MPHEPLPHAAHVPPLVHQLVVPLHESGLVLHLQPTVTPPQVGVAPEQTVHEGPHEVAVLHATQLAPLQVAPAPQEVASQVHFAPSHSGVPPLQVEQVAPQWAAVLHDAQVPPLHHLPLPHWASVTHCTQVVPPLQTPPVAVQSVQEPPQC